MDDQNKNLILATALSFIVILIWFVLFPPPEQTEAELTAPVGTQSTESSDTLAEDIATTPSTAEPSTSTATAESTVAETEAEEAPRIGIDTPSLKGAISLKGGRIDQLSLKNYRETLEPDSDIVELLAPVSSENPYYALFGWAPGSGLTQENVPSANTLWSVEKTGTLTPASPVVLTWDNGAGLTFRREFSVDNKYMFTVTQTVRNSGDATPTLAPYGIIARHGEPRNLKNFFILHEGAILMADGVITETKYGKMDSVSEHETIVAQETGWSGFTDHFWMTTLIPDDAKGLKISAFHDTRRNIFQTTAQLKTISLAPNDTYTASTRLFAGAKEWETIRNYQNNENVPEFINSIDWGWFFFLTKPIFAVLHWFNATLSGIGIAGSMGWAIIGLTLFIKALLLPLAFKSYVSMAKMKELQPQMETIKEQAGGDRQKLQQEMMALYKKEKVNPASGCLPILLQIPIFFSLYKVIFVTLELRHAPWIGWIKDLSAPDPSSLYNLWGILPWAAPDHGTLLATVFIGLLPLLLGISMWLQQKLNPAPTDPTQQMIFAWMPWVFMFMLGRFASGLVIYWIANNTITFSQQYLIMRSQGFKPDVFGNIMASFRKRAGGEEKRTDGDKK